MDIERVWKEYNTDVKAFLYSRVSNCDDVDDLLQDIFIKACQNIHTLNSQKNIKPWLFQIASHTIIDFYRKKSKLRKLLVEGIELQEESLEPISELSHCVIPLIQDLPHETAELLLAIDIEGQSQKDYAANLGLNYSTLKSRVQRGRNQLRNLFEDCCHLTFDQYGGVVDFEPQSQHCQKC
jgi:RNA polymerase sigma-70 factor (ECF subfamily)